MAPTQCQGVKAAIRLMHNRARRCKVERKGAPEYVVGQRRVYALRIFRHQIARSESSLTNMMPSRSALLHVPTSERPTLSAHRVSVWSLFAGKTPSFCLSSPSTSEARLQSCLNFHVPTMDNTKATNPRRYGQCLYLKPECLDEYKKIHAAVWPEVLAQIDDSNIQDCT